MGDKAQRASVVHSTLFDWIRTCFRLLPEHCANATGQVPMSPALSQLLRAGRGPCPFEDLQQLYSLWEAASQRALGSHQAWLDGDIAECALRTSASKQR